MLKGKKRLRGGIGTLKGKRKRKKKRKGKKKEEEEEEERQGSVLEACE